MLWWCQQHSRHETFSLVSSVQFLSGSRSKKTNSTNRPFSIPFLPGSTKHVLLPTAESQAQHSPKSAKASPQDNQTNAIVEKHTSTTTTFRAVHCKECLVHQDAVILHLCRHGVQQASPVLQVVIPPWAAPQPFRNSSIHTKQRLLCGGDSAAAPQRDRCQVCHLPMLGSHSLLPSCGKQQALTRTTRRVRTLQAPSKTSRIHMGLHPLNHDAQHAHNHWASTCI
eukprot:5435135-Amphidinium_carterae.1